MSELSLIVKATVILTVGLAAAALARRTRASIRHVILASTLLALLLLPVTTVVVPEVAIELPMASSPAVSAPATNAALLSRTDATTSAASTAAAAPTRSSLPPWPDIVRGVWAAGTIALLLSLGVNLWQFRRLRRHGLPWTDGAFLFPRLAAAAGVTRRVDVLLHEDVSAPAACGWRMATVLLPSDAPDWAETEVRSAIIHELEHIRRNDWVVHLMARAACALFWFHPLVWLTFGRLCLEAERACDDAVLQAAEHANYAEQLVRLARRMSNAPAQPLLAMAKRSDLATRVSAILDLTQSRGRLGAMQVGSVLSGAALLMFAVAPLRAVGMSPKPAQAAAAQSRRPIRPEVRRSAALDRALLEAAGDGDLETMSSLIASGANVNGAVPGDGSPLITAARGGRLDAVRALLDRGADPNLAVPGDGNPLIMAARAGRTGVVELLLARGASIDQVAEGDENALIQASAAGQLDVVRLLVARGADVNARVWVNEVWRALGTPRPDGEWRTPLNMAQRGKHDAIVNYLRSAGAHE
jgi:beta-lactamase regulating signal transducer with metallopeptidase domain